MIGQMSDQKEDLKGQSPVVEEKLFPTLVYGQEKRRGFSQLQSQNHMVYSAVHCTCCGSILL